MTLLSFKLRFQQLWRLQVKTLSIPSPTSTWRHFLLHFFFLRCLFCNLTLKMSIFLRQRILSRILTRTRYHLFLLYFLSSRLDYFPYQIFWQYNLRTLPIMRKNTIQCLTYVLKKEFFYHLTTPWMDNLKVRHIIALSSIKNVLLFVLFSIICPLLLWFCYHFWSMFWHFQVKNLLFSHL